MDFYKILNGGIGVGMSNFDRLFAEKHGGGGIQEITGALPLAVRSRASQVLKNYTIYGESVQDGTPTPDNPVEVTGLGVRTVNLFDGSYLSYGINSFSGEIISASGRFAFYISVEPNTSYTISRIIGASSYFYYGFTDAVPTAGMTCAVFGDIGANATTKTLANQNHKYLMFFFGTGKSEKVMLTEGSTTPSSYIPYGYQIPIKITSNGTTTDYPIYIGDSQLMRIPNTEYADYVDFEKGKIVRRVKKLVLTGEEDVTLDSTSFKLSGYPSALIKQWVNIQISSHYTLQISFTSFDLRDGQFYVYTSFARIKDLRYSSTSSFKEYLANQYEAGTPVTICYALETPVEEDPPVPFPDITLPRGEVTIDIDGELKPQAIVKGLISPTN